MHKKYGTIHNRVSPVDKLVWCLKLKKGIEIIEPNKNLANTYLKKAEDALSASKILKDNLDWEISTAYYAQYFSLYAILVKIGIKCENHSCTMAFMNFFLQKFLDEKDIDLVKISKDARVNTQYYSNRKISSEKHKLIIQKTPLFIIKCKNILLNISKKDILKIRKELIELNKKIRKKI